MSSVSLGDAHVRGIQRFDPSDRGHPNRCAERGQSRVQNLHKEQRVSYRDHTWEQQQFEAMERVHKGIEGAWHYANWLRSTTPVGQTTDDRGAARTEPSLGAVWSEA
jgi:hypothetical protein